MSTHISVPPQLLLERILTLEIVRVTERAAVSAARLPERPPARSGFPTKAERRLPEPDAATR